MNMEQLAKDFAEYEGIRLPTCWQICDTCHGEGTSTAYLGAYTQSDREEMGEEWFDFMDDVRRGVYDRNCEMCSGTGKQRLVDEEALQATPELYNRWNLWVDEAYEDYRVQQMERRMGA